MPHHFKVVLDRAPPSLRGGLCTLAAPADAEGWNDQLTPRRASYASSHLAKVELKEGMLDLMVGEAARGSSYRHSGGGTRSIHGRHCLGPRKKSENLAKIGLRYQDLAGRHRKKVCWHVGVGGIGKWIQNALLLSSKNDTPPFSQKVTLNLKAKVSWTKFCTRVRVGSAILSSLTFADAIVSSQPRSDLHYGIC